MTTSEIIQNYECATFVAYESTYRELMAVFLVSGYGVAQQCRSAKNTDEERTLLVVNVKFDPKFRENISSWSGYYDQDTFVYSPEGTETPEVAERFKEKLQLDTFNRYGVNGKHAISLYARQLKAKKEKQHRKDVIEMYCYDYKQEHNKYFIQ